MVKSKRRGVREKGSTLVEGALVTLVFLTILFGLMDFGRMVWNYTQLAYGAREATRYAIVHGADSGHTASTNDIKAIVTHNTPGLDSSNLTTTVTFSPDQSSGSTVKVVCTYKFYPIAPYIPVGPLSMKSTSQMVIYQ
jgi:Flp pilus assembly protein TadG